ncbi:hypothetical protein NDU88_003730 [Pleurodeles waltl]|uniref:Sushi domain-containing protein n=2 Tax=Pleurodeles waltl TaxID=8319 RepID=A0AAV7T5X5_PLEWA|nr:hypothetical protein NDU88_003730 [Pleurodeles waltl]
MCNDGVWTKKGGAGCREKPCGHPGDIEFGTFELTKADEFVFGARVEYKCDEGYQIISRVTYRDCTATGWSNSVPFCESRKCVQFPAPKNGKIIATGTHSVDDEVSPGHVLRFECHSPLERPIPNEVYCTSDGHWSHDSVECKEINCPEPAIPHGTIANSKPVFRKDERLEFNCEKGYKYDGRVPECTEEGWNPKPSCKEIECYYETVINGEMLPKQDKYRQDDTVNLHCRSGFVALYSRDRQPTCTKDGWVPPLKCESKACEYPEIENGKLSSWSYNYYQSYYFPMSKGREIDYECHRNYATESGYQSGRITCSDEGWSPTPRCLRSCERPYFYNMDMSFNKPRYTEGQTVSFRCHPGFSTHAGQEAGIIECLSNGRFSQVTCIPTCKLLLTGAIKSYKPKKELFSVEDRVQYECNDGYHSYQKNIVETSECTAEGWRYEPQCQEIRCSLNVDSRRRTRSFKNRDVAKLTCPEGFSLNGAEKVQCYYFGWYPDLPSCTEIYYEYGYTENPIFDDSDPAVGRGIECLEPPKLKNSEEQRTRSSYEHGETVTYSCNRNYILYGPQTITCENGRWTSPPQCIGRGSCSKPPTINNGKRIMPANKRYFYSDDTVTYQCDAGYRITGSNESTCIGGRWTATPTCSESPCNVPLIEYGSVVELRAQYIPGTTVQFKCEPGYKLISERQTKCLNGEWSFLPNCISTSCGAAPVVKDGFVERPRESYQSGERVAYKCKSGFVFQKLSYVTCEEGQWTEKPVCIKEGSKCGTAPFLPNGDITGMPQPFYPSGSKVEYKCQSYHKMLGNSRVTCINGAWSTLPECLEPCTASPEEMAENNIRFRWLDEQKLYTEHDQYVEFICLRDYIPHVESAPFRLTCIRGKLLYPRCIKEGSCTPSSNEMDPKNIILINENTEIKDGNMAEFACKPGFYKKPNHKMTVKCIRGKLDYPECDNTPPVCPRPPLVPHGKIVGDVKNQYILDSSIEYTCDKNHVLEGSRMLTCFEGRWLGDVPQCIPPCQLTEDEITKNNLELYHSEDISQAVKHKTSIPFKCKEGYITDPHLQLFGQCKNGTITYPSCVLDSPCHVTKEKLEENFVELSPKQRDKTAFKEGETIVFTCKSGFRVLTTSGSLTANCTKAGFIYPTCINPNPCRISQEGIDLHNLELMGEVSVFRQGETIKFKCKSGYFENTPLIGTCKNSIIAYPTCMPIGACFLKYEEIEQKNIKLLTDLANILYATQDQIIDFSCKEGHIKSTRSGDMSQVCEDGIITYPTCVRI